MAKDKLDDADYENMRNMEFSQEGSTYAPHALDGIDDPHTDFGLKGKSVSIYQPPGGGPGPGGSGTGTVIFTVIY